MKDYILKGAGQPSAGNDSFLNGLVFGFDVGTGSIGYAVRKGKDFKDVGVLICPEDTNKLDVRRGLRSQRRRLRNRSRIRDWLSRQLEEKLGLPSPWTKTESGQIALKPGLDQARISNPVLLRCEALDGRLEKPEELHAAITHLWKRRGKTEVPWKQGEAKEETAEQKKENKIIESKLNALAKEMAIGNGTADNPKPFAHPCQLLRHRQRLGVKQRDEVWPRDEFQNPDFNLKKEFLAIIEKGTALKNEKGEMLPKLPEIKVTFQDDEGKSRTASAADWILYGDTQTIINKGNKRRVYFKTTKCENPGVLGLRWPRFDNREPGLDALEPFRKDAESGAWIPQHTLRRDNEIFKEWQLDVALNKFVVVKRLPPAGRRQKERTEKSPPPPRALAALRQMWHERGHLWGEDLREWAEAFKGQFELRDPEEDLTPKNLAGRARFSKLGMAAIHRAIAEAREKHDSAYESWERKFREKNGKAKEEDIANGYARFLTQQTAAKTENDNDNSYARTIAPPPVLMLPGETQAEALRRYIYSIRDPRVRHRVEMFTREFRRLMELHNKGAAPDFVVIEMARELMMNDEQKQKKEQNDKERKARRDKAAEILRDMGFRPDDENIKKFLLADEVGWKCPFTLKNFCQSDFSNLTITQLVQAENKPKFVQEAKSVFERLEIEHLVPRTPIVCNEWFNLTVTLNTTNAQKRKRTPFQWLSLDRDGVPADLTWEVVCKNAAQRFEKSPLKLQIFTSPDAARLIEENAKRSIQQTAYIARCLREACLILFGKEWLDWTDGVGRDPRLLKNNRASTSFLTTNGVITSRLRGAWNLNELLHPRVPNDEWEALSEDQRKMRKLERSLKNRQDHRHHGIDAMVIACTLPWVAYKSRVGSNAPGDGWCEVDRQTGEIVKIWNPMFNDYGFGIRKAAETKAALLLKYADERETDLLRHHRANLRNAQAFDTTPYGRREKFNGDEIGQTLFVARKRLLDLKTSHLNSGSTGGFIFSPLLREHIAKAWQEFRSDEKNWLRVQGDWLARFEKEKIELEAKKAELEGAGKKTVKEVKAIRARAARIHALHEMEKTMGWDELLKFIDKELNPSAQPQPKFPAEFIATLHHPIYGTPIESVKITAQSKDDDSFLLVREAISPNARSGTYVMRKTENKFRELRVYRAKPGRGRRVPFVFWPVLPWYRDPDSGKGFSWRSKLFQKWEAQLMPKECQGAQFIRAFRKGEIVAFPKAYDPKRKKSASIKAGESWRITKTAESRGEITLLRAHEAEEVTHPITQEKIKSEELVLPFNDFMFALGYADESHELPHSSSVKPQPESPHQA